jgi:nucleotide-binding universal stress UspA family protein
MAEWKKVCCAIDFSDACRFAMAEAADIARRFQGQLTLVHVYEPPTPAPGEMLEPGEQLFGAIWVDLGRAMAAWRADAGQRTGARVRSTVRVGEAAEEILHFAREERMDLIVLGSHGDHGHRHLALGSVAERVVREAPCPVLVIRAKELGDPTHVPSEAAEYV